MEILPEELVLFIWEFFNTNKEMISLIRTCKRFKKLGNKFGYIKFIRFGMHTDYMNLVHLHHNRNDFLNNLTMEGLDNPIQWTTPKWPREMIFDRCSMGGRLIDPQVSETEVLVIRNFVHSNNSLKINWSKLPKLRVLDIRVPDMEFDGIESCQNLEIIRIDIDKYKELPDFFATFPKLIKIGVSCHVNHALHFVSKDLKICFINKKTDFTSASEVIPQRHLQRDFSNMNLQCMSIAY